MFTTEYSSIVSLDTCALAGIDPNFSKEAKHLQFLQGGIDVAAQSLRSKFKDGISVAIGLSIGGMVLWRAIQTGMKVESLICLSSTRLRFEDTPPPTTCHLFFGSEDPYQPSDSWFGKMVLHQHTVKGYGHEFYKEAIVFEILSGVIHKS